MGRCQPGETRDVGTVRSDVAAGRSGLVHEAALYGSDDELLDMVVPFVSAGADAGEPTIVVLDDRRADLVHATVGGDARVTFLRQDVYYERPARTIRAYRTVVEQQVAAGAAQVRAVGGVGLANMTSSWDRWSRYEAAIDRALADLPLWAMCTYDTRETPDHVLADVDRMHVHFTTPDGRHVESSAGVSAETVVAGRPPRPPDPVEARRPDIEMDDPTPAGARRGVLALGRAAGIGDDALDDLRITVSEVVSNAWLHGRPPVRMRAWAGADRLVVTVTDHGAGPDDPLVGLVPASGLEPGGWGLWIAHQLCRDIDLVPTDDAFTVRLTVPVP